MASMSALHAAPSGWNCHDHVAGRLMRGRYVLSLNAVLVFPVRDDLCSRKPTTNMTRRAQPSVNIRKAIGQSMARCPRVPDFHILCPIVRSNQGNTPSPAPQGRRRFAVVGIDRIDKSAFAIRETIPNYVFALLVVSAFRSAAYLPCILNRFS